MCKYIIFSFSFFCKIKNTVETKQNETKRNKTKQNETKRNKTKRNETKRNETKQNETKRNETKRNKTKRNETKRNETKQNKTKQNKTLTHIMAVIACNWPEVKTVRGFTFLLPINCITSALVKSKFRPEVNFSKDG